MPSRVIPSRYKKASRKRFYKRKKRYGKNLVLSKAPVPNKFATKLRYADNIVIQPLSGLVGVHIFNANGLYDPDTTGTGHQPRGFDEFMSMYDHYTVIGAKITAWFCGSSGSATNSPTVIGIALKDFTNLPTTKNDYMEGRNVVSTLLAFDNETHEVKRLTKTFSTRKFLGVSKPLASSVLRGSASGNPTEDAYFHIFAQALQPANIDPIRVQVVIDYLVVFTEPKQPAQS